MVDSEAQLEDQSKFYPVNDELDERAIGGICNERLFADIGINGDKLQFLDFDHFRGVLECLEYQVDLHNDEFEAQHTALSDDEIDSVADSLNFDDWQPLVDFEQRFSFGSRRKFIEDKILLWLDNPVLDTLNDPDELDGLSEELRTLLNVNGEVVIGKETINYLVEESTERATCFIYKRKADYFDNPWDNKHRIKLKAVAHSYPWKMKIKSKVVNYKKKNNGNWKRSRTRLYIAVSALVRDTDCNFPLRAGLTNGPKRRKSLKAKQVVWWPPAWPRFKRGEVSGYTTVGDGQFSASITL